MVICCKWSGIEVRIGLVGLGRAISRDDDPSTLKHDLPKNPLSTDDPGVWTQSEW